MTRRREASNGGEGSLVSAIETSKLCPREMQYDEVGNQGHLRMGLAVGGQKWSATLCLSA